MKQKMNKGRGKAGCPPKRKNNGDNVQNEAHIRVMFFDNTMGGQLAKRMGRMTGYRVRIAVSAGMPLSRLLPSKNPWGAGDCGRQDCVLCGQDDEKQQICKMWNILCIPNTHSKI